MIITNNLIFGRKYNIVLDTDVVNYITATGEMDTTFINALNTLIVYWKNNGIYSKIQMLHFLLGTAFKAKFNFINNGILQLTFYGSGVISNTGYQLNGVNSYADTGFNPQAIQDNNSNSIFLVSRTNNTPITINTIDFGSFNSNQASYIALKDPLNFGGNTGVQLNDQVIVSTNTDAKGIFIGTKQNSTVTKIFKNGTEIESGNSGGTLNSYNLYIGNLNFLNTPYTNGWSNQELCITGAAEGLSDLEAVILSTGLDTFCTTLGIKTW